MNNTTILEQPVTDSTTIGLTAETGHEVDDIPSLTAQPVASTTSSAFIEANTTSLDLEDIKYNHVIPVFVKDNEPTISHSDFIETTYESIMEVYPRETILAPAIRVSHPIKGRVPEARLKPAAELFEWEKTIYYERMMFLFEIPTIQDEIDGNVLSLTVGGVKSYNQDNLYNRKGADEHFKVFVGFKNKVCTNLCVWTDGYLSDLKVKNVGQLKGAIKTLLENYNAVYQAYNLRQLTESSLTEQQFANVIGRCRMYQYLPMKQREGVPALLLGDQQITSVCREYFKDKSFCRNDSGDISLWKLYNLFTGANKSTYIDQFLDRSVNAYQVVENLRFSLEGKKQSWYLS